MASQIFVNLPVKNLNNSIDFFTNLGFTFNLEFTDEKAACMIIGENIFSMLLVEDFFKTFTHKDICDSTKCTEVIIALSAESREEVNKMITPQLNRALLKPENPRITAGCTFAVFKILTVIYGKLCLWTKMPGVPTLNYY